jgi:hypothetical protein
MELTLSGVVALSNRHRTDDEFRLHLYVERAWLGSTTGNLMRYDVVWRRVPREEDRLGTD